MGLFFRKSIKFAPGLRLNVSKRGTSVSIGPRGAKINIGKRGTYLTTSIPGTGIYSRTKISGGVKQGKNSAYSQPKISDSEKFAKADPMAQGCGLLVGCLVGGLGLWLISGKFYAFLIMALVGIIMAFIPSLLAGNKDTETESMDNHSENQELKEIQQDVDYSRQYLDQLNGLLEDMDKATDEVVLIDTHNKIVELMDSKLKGRRILFNGMSYDDAMKLIDDEFQNDLNAIMESKMIYPMSEEQTAEISNKLSAIKDANTSLEALNSYNEARNHLKQYENAKGIIYNGLNYTKLFELAYQTYIDKCKELNKK